MKYVAMNRPKSEDWYWDEPVVKANTVYEQEDGPELTGLYDASGTPIYRLSDKPKMGFCR